MSELPVLDATDQRILGSLLEKQTTVPATYPLSANALVSACNQTSSRDPVTDLDQQTVERTAKSLKERGLLRIVWSDTGRRTLKYHQILDEHLGLEPDERALLTVLLLRGAQVDVAVELVAGRKGRTAGVGMGSVDRRQQGRRADAPPPRRAAFAPAGPDPDVVGGAALQLADRGAGRPPLRPPRSPARRGGAGLDLVGALAP